MLTPYAPWITTPDQFLRAAEAGTRAAQEQQRLGLETMSLMQRGAEAEAGRGQRELDRRAQLALEGERLKRGEYESNREYAERLKQYGLAERKQTLEETKLGMPKYFHDARGGIYGIDPMTGELNVLQKPTQSGGKSGTVSVPFMTGEGLLGRISIAENDPRLAAWRSLKPTVENVPAIPGKHWWNRDVPAMTITNQPPSLADYLRTNLPSAASPIAPDEETPDVEGLGEPVNPASPLRVLSIE